MMPASNAVIFAEWLVTSDTLSVVEKPYNEVFPYSIWESDSSFVVQLIVVFVCVMLLADIEEIIGAVVSVGGGGTGLTTIVTWPPTAPPSPVQKME